MNRLPVKAKRRRPQFFGWRLVGDPTPTPRLSGECASVSRTFFGGLPRLDRSEVPSCIRGSANAYPALLLIPLVTFQFDFSRLLLSLVSFLGG